MNVVTQLQQPPPQSGPTRSASEAEDITPDFLSIRLVNKRTRAKLSPEPLDLTPIPNKGQLFVVASTLGWFVAIIRSSTGLALVTSPLADLRSHLSSLDAKSDNTFQPQRKIPFSSVTPNHILFALNDSRLVVGLTHGPVIVFEASDICSPGDNEVSPLHTFLSTTPAPTAVRQMYANPGDIPELVAILREPDGSPNSQLVEVINVSTMQSVAGWSAGGTPETFPTSISWSPKGKQLAIALQSGDIITFSPSETLQAKSFIARPPSMQGQSIIHATWLSNPAFYTIFAPAGPLDPQVDQKHMVIVHDAKRPDTSADVFLPINFFPSGVRPPGAFTIALRGWDPAKILLLVGDSTTADIGLVCCTTDDKWQKLAFDESAPSMPLDADQNETTMIGFELDLKNTTSYDVTTSTGETVSVPPPPVVWAYASDGTVTAWYVVNTRGTPYPSMGQATTLSPVSAPAAPAPTTSPFPQAAQPAFGQTSPSAFGQPSQPSLAFSSGGSTFDQPAFGQASVPGSTFGQRPTFGSPAFTQTSAGSTFGQPSSSGQAPSGEGFVSFASAPVKWGQSNFGSTVSSFTSAAAPGSPPQIQPSESTESMSTDSGQEVSFSGMSLGQGTNDTQPKAGSGMTGMFGSPAPVTQSAAPATTSAFGSGSFNLSPGVGAFSKFVPRQTGDAPNVPTVEVPKPSSAFGQTGFGAPAFGQSGFGQSAGQSAFGKTGLGTPMSTTPIVTPVSTTSPSFGSGGAFSAFASGGPATLSGSKPAETKLATPTMSGGGAFGAFASSGPSGFGQAASTTAESVPAWKTGGDATFGSGTGSSVFGGKSSTSPLVSAATPAKSLFASAEPAPSTTPAFSPPTTTSLEKATPSSAGATPLTPPSDGATPSRGSQSPPDDSTAPTSPFTAADLSKPTVPAESTTPAGPPPVANAFMGLKMSTGFGLSNFNAKDSPFANPKPVSQSVSAFGGGQPPAPKMPVPATPGSVFGQTSTIGTAAKAVSAFGEPAFESPSTPTVAASTTPSSSQTESSSAFSAFSGIASAFGKTVGSGVSFSEMLRHAGSSPDSKSKDTQAKASSENGPTPPTPKSVFDKSPTPRPANIPAAPESEDEGDGDKGKGKARQVLSAESSFSNLSSSTSSFVDVPRGGEEEEEGAVTSDGGDGEQQIDEFLSGTDSEGEGHEEEEEEEESEGEGEEHEEDEGEGEEVAESDDEENKLPSPTEAEPTAVPLPKSRSPSSTPKAERPAINVQSTSPPKPEPKPEPEPEPEPLTTSSAGSTTPPGSPSTAPLQQPTPMLPSPSQTPSPSPSSTSSSLSRPSTRPLRSSPLANAPVSGGDEEEVKGEKPASLKPRPASPKTPFGKWDGSAKARSPTPPPTILESSVDQVTEAVPPSLIPRPKSPPPLTAKGTPLNNKPSSSLVTGPAVTPPAQGSGWIGLSLGGSGLKPDTKSTAEDATKPATTTTPSLFAGTKPDTGTEAPAALDSKVAPSPLFGTKPPAVSGTTTPATGPPRFGNLPGAIPGVVTPATSANDVLTPSRAPEATSLITPPKETPSAEPMVPMQIEFAALYTEVQTEMAALTAFVRDTRESRERKMKPTSGQSSADIIGGLTKTIRECASDIEQLELARNEDDVTIRELEIGVLKAKTRKEEIARFDKARSDVEFGKMMRARILSPEQTELQTQLRRDMRSIQDRVTKMEDHLQGSKKKLNEFKTGKPSIKAPSLDTVNRTSRNINIAIRQQSADITALSSRIAKLNIEGGSPSSTSSRAHERDLVRRPLDVTPHVASTTAAALNAEQAARRLKEALLAVRTEPLLNKQAANARPALRAFDTPQKPDADLASSGGSLGGGLLSTPLTLPSLNVSDSTSRGVSPPLGRRSTQKHHAKSVQLRSTPTAGTTTKPSFDWGPLPGIKPMMTIPSDLRSKTE